MKSIITSLSFLIIFSFTTDAQVNPHAIGIRFKGDDNARGAELTYQHGFGDKNRIELDLGGRSHENWRQFGLAVIYHWVWNITDGLNWYVGPGGSIGIYRSKNSNNNGLTLALGGQIGLEYDFNEHNVPLLLSLDWRPMWNFIGYTDYNDFGYESGLSLRYTF